MLWNREIYMQGSATGDSDVIAPLCGQLRGTWSQGRASWCEVETWIESGGPLDAPIYMSAGAHRADPSLAYPGQFTLNAAVPRPGA